MYLEADLKRRLKEAAARHRSTEAAVIREALRRYLDHDVSRPIRTVGRSTDGGVAHRVDEALDELGFARP